ncbi:TnpA family transposase [Arcticibacter tournemirensis]|jgi:TnpA family transposase|uniref:Tn3 family transposase n=1 Tax=Arcticibacter tournemirensis TaxID=699437 RepID=A0A5M9GUF0_9SPHI|nr:Tn3 family transposase [Arcticibacter tournemirensis]KAA8477499.1 Tn3 family transposase [Arcticibacter tournemirensis]TQM51328.1 TnpA family transposase [Arcticibacter tournemirensis]
MAGQFLTHTERERYEYVPSSISPEDLNRYFYLSDSDIALIKEQRGNEQRLGFACQLCLIRFMGFLTDEWETSMPKLVLERLSEQLQALPSDLKNYSTRRNTRADHLQSILKHLHFSRFAPMDAVQLEAWLLERSLEHDKPTLLLDLACEKLIQNRILRPAIGTLERMVVSVRGQAYTETYTRLSVILNPELKIRLDALLMIEEGSSFTCFGWLKEPPNSNTPSTLNNVLTKYQYLINIGVADWDLTVLNPNRKKFLSQKARRSTNQEIQRMNPEKRYPILIAFLAQNLIDVTDSVLDMFEAYLDDVLHKCRRSLEIYQQETVNAKDNAMATLSFVATMVADEKIPPEQIRTKVFSNISKVELDEAISVTQEILKPARSNFLSFLDNHFNRLRQFSGNFLKTLAFFSGIRDDNFLYAIEIVLGLQNGSRKKIPDDAPLDFITPTWAKYVFDDKGEVIKQSYEWCVLFKLKDKLNSGDVFVSNSRRYADLDGYLIPKEQWKIKKEELCGQLYISPDALTHINGKIKELEDLLPLVNDLLVGTDEVRLEDGILVVPRLQAQELPDSVYELENAISSRLPLVDLPEILMEVNSWTNFTNHLTSIHDGKCPEIGQIHRVYASLLSNACNIPWVDMARSANIEYYDLLWSIRSYQREDTLKLANNHLVNYHHKQWLSNLWGGGTISSSDGQRFPVSGKIRNAKAQLKYFGYGKGVTFYTHTADQYSQFGSKVIASTERDAMYVLDEILNNETELNILEHTTDTSGYTDLVFGLFDLLGMQFSPRLRDIKDQKLSKIKGKDFEYPSLKFTGVVNPDYIAGRWDDLLRLAGSMKSGYVTSSLFIGKLQSYPRQNNLTYVLQEYGRLIKTIFILKYLLSQTLRRKINTQLNKGEALHSLRNFLWFGGDGKIRKKQEEQQQEQALCLNVATNSVILWNTIYMQEVLNELQKEGFNVNQNDIVHLSPARFSHINRLGKYFFDFDENGLNGNLRQLRVNA